jgi:hypothetical protein
MERESFADCWMGVTESEGQRILQSVPFWPGTFLYGV